MEEKSRTTIEQRVARHKEQFLEELEKGPIIETACTRVGVSRATFYRWRGMDKKFADDVKHALRLSVDVVNDLAESKLIGLIKLEDFRAIVYWLNHNHPRFKSKYTFEEQINIELQRVRQFKSEMIMLKAENVNLADTVSMLQKQERARLYEEQRKKDKEKEEETIRRARAAYQKAPQPKPSDPTPTPVPEPRKTEPEQKKIVTPPLLLLPAPPKIETPEEKAQREALEKLFGASSSEQ